MNIFNIDAFLGKNRKLTAALLVGASLTLTACGAPKLSLPDFSGKKKAAAAAAAPAVCPTVQLRPGGEAVGVNGAGGTYQARIVQLKTACEYNKGQLETQVKILFEVAAGQYNRATTAELPYFISANDGQTKSRTRRIYYTDIPIPPAGQSNRVINVVQHLMPSGAAQTVLQVGFVHGPGIQPLAVPVNAPGAYQQPIAPIPTAPLVPGVVNVTPTAPVNPYQTGPQPIPVPAPAPAPVPVSPTPYGPAPTTVQ